MDHYEYVVTFKFLTKSNDFDIRSSEYQTEAAIKNGIRAENVFVSLDVNAPETMADMIRSALEPGDVLLVKASRGVAAERVLACLQKSSGGKKE